MSANPNHSDFLQRSPQSHNLELLNLKATIACLPAVISKEQVKAPHGTPATGTYPAENISDGRSIPIQQRHPGYQVADCIHGPG
ncbi:hypothetical protein J5X98_04285 [Leptothermofonsia sichuanensis E412]|uniref:hypothetical protein n=1 Tax=Leptothermofonsia sichuanensis TaxID=2917832 RepID=UPI001CA7A52F|nr:hypothetical protein [Leptothermofonsia sichuanensis]QZZ21682.1 hypothetical protein J5X98_04285 [Leptothermofonsia sichuanensis E412]